MNSDLIVATFNSPEMAQTVYDSLQAMSKSLVLGLDSAAIVARDGAGSLVAHPRPKCEPGLADVLAGLIFGIADPSRSSAPKEELDVEFLETVASAFCENSSALLFLMDPDSLGDTRELLSVLSLFPCTIHQTTVSRRSAALLRAML